MTHLDLFQLLQRCAAFGEAAATLAVNELAQSTLVILAGLAFAGVEIALGLMPSYLTFAALTPVLGFALLTMLNAANTTVQLSVDPVMRGRVMALYMMLVMGGTPLGAPLIGWVGATFGARWTLIGGGAVTLLGLGLAVILRRRLDRVNGRAGTETVPTRIAA